MEHKSTSYQYFNNHLSILNAAAANTFYPKAKE